MIRKTGLTGESEIKGNVNVENNGQEKE